MELFIDTAEIDEIKSLNVTGLIDGVTTNPSLIAKQGADMAETIKNIWALGDSAFTPNLKQIKKFGDQVIFIIIYNIIIFYQILLLILQKKWIKS